MSLRPEVIAIALLASASACSSPAPERAPCTRASRVELKRVEEGSAYMRRAYAHVGATGKDEAPTEPAAIAAGISAHVDIWQADDLTPDGLPRGRKTYNDWYLIGRDRAALERYVEALGSPGPGHEVRLQRVVPEPGGVESTPYWRTYYLRSEALLDDRSFADVRAGQPHEADPSWNRTILVDLTKQGARQFGEITGGAVGHKLATLVDGDVFSAPVIMSAIPGGRFSIFTATEAASAELLARLACKN
jgi:hypothetical protein